jgi:hypothetical protein
VEHCFAFEEVLDFSISVKTGAELISYASDCAVSEENNAVDFVMTGGEFA